jgi:tetratricopeptide (TPR) repeat protein
MQGSVELEGLYDLAPRAIVAVIRRLVLPLEKWAKDGAYGPFIRLFSRGCDAAEPWYALGHDPREIKNLALEGVEMRGTKEEMQIWSVLWSASRTMEFARTKNLQAAYSQFVATVELIQTWRSDHAVVKEASRRLQEYATAYVAHAAASVRRLNDPPVDRDALVVPEFYYADPEPMESIAAVINPKAAESIDDSQTNSMSPLLFDEQVSGLIDLLRAGRMAVFCGAGISIGSGIPSASVLRAALLKQLPCSEREAAWLGECDLPFEAFLDSVIQESEPNGLYDIFRLGEPSGAHLFLAELVSRGLLRTIATTNFDELIESAVARVGSECRVLWRQADLADIDSANNGARIIKLHGTVSQPDSVALTMREVAGRQPMLGRQQAIQNLFLTGAHDAVLVLGYSCSDLFDITPHILSLGGTRKRVYFVEHTPSEMRAEEVQKHRRKNPFHNFEYGTRMFCDTNILLQRVSREIGLSTQSCTAESHQWHIFVQRWWKNIPKQQQAMAGHAILGHLWYKCSQYRAAKAHYRAALAEATPTFVYQLPQELAFSFMFPRSPSNEGARQDALVRIGGCHRALSEYPQAMDCFEEAAALTRSSGDVSTEAELSAAMGTVLFNTGNFAEAARKHERSVEIWKRLGNEPWSLGRALANLGNAYGAMNRYDEALACFQKGVEIARDVGDKAREGSRLGGLAQTYQLMGKLEEAEALHRAALEIAVALSDRTGIAHQLAGLGAILEARGALEDATENCIKASAMFRQNGDRQGEARSVGNAGACFLRMGRLTEAIDCLVYSLEIAVGIGDPSVRDVALRNLDVLVRAAEADGITGSEIVRVTDMLEKSRQARQLDGTTLRDALQQLVRTKFH